MFLQMDPNLTSNKKARRLRRRLEVKPREVVGILHSLWSYTLCHCADGVLADHTAEDIAEVCDWDDDGNVFAAALIDAGFLEEAEDGYRVASWDEHTGGALSRKAEHRERERLRSAENRKKAKVENAPVQKRTPDESVRTQKLGAERNGTERNGTNTPGGPKPVTEQLKLGAPEPKQPKPTAEEILNGKHDGDPKFLRRKTARVCLIEWHCKLWDGNPNHFKPDSKALKKALDDLAKQGYQPSQVWQMAQGMRWDPWPERETHNGFEHLARLPTKWLKLHAKGPNNRGPPTDPSWGENVEY